MATLRIRFPEKETLSTLLLTGARITIGRRPDNTVQIIDRTLSGQHAELIMEGDHYRMHDAGSSNGTFVNGERVADYHLTEPCQITFGSVACEFDPHATANADDPAIETLPSHAEVRAVREENSDLKAKIEALQAELTALNHASSSDDPAATLKEDFSKILAERESWQEEQHRQAQEIARLKADLAVLQRDRENLQQALGNTRRELDRLAESGAAPTAEGTGEPRIVDTPPGTATDVSAAPAPAPAAVSPPKPSPNFSTSRPAPSLPGVAAKAALAPTPRPPASPPAPAGRPPGAMPAPKAVPVARATAQPASGTTPIPRPPAASPSNAPRPFVRTGASPATVVDTTSGKGSTQKIPIPAQGNGASRTNGKEA